MWFLSGNCCSMDTFSFSDHSMDTLEMVVWVKPSRSAVSVIIRSSLPGINNHATFKVKSSFLPICHHACVPKSTKLLPFGWLIAYLCLVTVLCTCIFLCDSAASIYTKSTASLLSRGSLPRFPFLLINQRFFYFVQSVRITTM